MNEEKRHVLKAVFDTNVLLSALIWHLGKPRLIFRKAISGSLKLFCCKDIITELRKVLERDFKEISDDIDQQISVVLTYAEPVEIAYNEMAVLDDSDDDVIINCALSAGADYIVSGDAHLLKLREYKGIKIVSPAEFIGLFE